MRSPLKCASVSNANCANARSRRMNFDATRLPNRVFVQLWAISARLRLANLELAADLRRTCLDGTEAAGVPRSFLVAAVKPARVRVTLNRSGFWRFLQPIAFVQKRAYCLARSLARKVGWLARLFAARGPSSPSLRRAWTHSLGARARAPELRASSVAPFGRRARGDWRARGRGGVTPSHGRSAAQRPAVAAIVGGGLQKAPKELVAPLWAAN